MVCIENLLKELCALQELSRDVFSWGQQTDRDATVVQGARHTHSWHLNLAACFVHLLVVQA